MAANNYYNFTHAGTQYGTQYTPTPGTPGYGAGQSYPGQPVAPGQPQPYGGNGGEAYAIPGYTRAAGQQGQATQQQQQGYYTQQQPTPGYPMTSPAAKMQAQGPRAAATSTAYPTYSANTLGTPSSSYAGFAPPQAQNTPPGTKASFTNYDAAVYNAVSAYAQGGVGSRGGGGGMGFRKGPKGIKTSGGTRPIPKPQTLHYCDVCKISCAGPQTYKEHLEGQKHKKKEAAQKVGTPTAPKGGPAGLRCELCDVTCTGSDAYAAHIRGAKHQKVLKLHTKLGKPIPSDNPTVIATPPATSLMNTSMNSTANVIPPKPVTHSIASAQGNQFTKAATPKINFIGSKPEATIAVGNDFNNHHQQAPPMSTTYAVPAAPGGIAPAPVAEDLNKSGSEDLSLFIEKDVQPVGQDYIEEMRNEEGKIISFNCKLCECRFNDPNAKEMHMKGRRHRLQYKKKVNPDLIVDVKPSSRQKKIDERRAARTIPLRKMANPNESYPSRGPVPLLPPGGPRGYGAGPGFGVPGPNPMFFIPPLIRRPESMEDRHVMAKHAEIYPKEEELQAIQKIVSNSEKALKCVSDRFAEEDCKIINGVKTEEGVEPPQPSEADLQVARVLKGVMRVGHLAKGLLLKGDRTVELAVLCSEKPTVTMLDRVMDALPKQLEILASEEKYEIRKNVPECGILIIQTVEPKIEVKITLTSPLMRAAAEATGEAQATQVTDPHDVLDKEKCLDALAALRHAKWFQARATALQSCVIVIRILRDLCQRVPGWHSMSCWAIELLTEKAINSAGMPVSPGEALRIVLEVIASGLLLPLGPGLLDPCEKESCDAVVGLPNQAREDITAYAQQALRQVAFRQIHRVLGMEALPRFNKKTTFLTRKRRRDHSGTGEGDEAETGNDGKKDKKEEVMETDKVDNVEIKSEVVA